MSRVDRVVARKMEAVVSRRRPKEGCKTGGIVVYKQHLRGDRWWRMRFAELGERRAGARS